MQADSVRIGFATESTWNRDADLRDKAPANGNARRGKALLLLSFGALGVVYGDIGTSPLYAMSAMFSAPPAREDVEAAVSLFFWALTLQPLLKYVVFVMCADDHGEGGTLAIYSLICRHIGMTTNARGAQLPLDRTSASVDSTDDGAGMHAADGCTRLPGWLRSSAGLRLRAAFATHIDLQRALLSLSLLGASMVLGDGVLTPSISVLSAVGGLQVATTAITTDVVIGITCTILVLLFSVQRMGTHKISAAFAPIVFIWFVFNAGVGLFNLNRYGWDMLAALNPAAGLRIFAQDFKAAWLLLNSVTLALTGAEAMYADLGHFNAPSIRLTFMVIVYPSLVFTYIGQGAFLAANPDQHRQVFWGSMPPGTFWPMLVVSTLTTVVASQALITACFSIVRQAMVLQIMPRMRILHTDKNVEGQIYMPVVNWLLCICCVAVVAGFKDATALGNAYGVAVVTVMFLTSIMFTIVIVVVWNLNPLVAVAYACLYIPLEGLLLSANLTKVPYGGWVALLFSAVIACIQFVFSYGTRRKSAAMAASRQDLGALLVEAAEPGAGCGGQMQLRASGQAVARVPGLGIVYSECVSGAPPHLQQLLHLVPALHEVVIFLTLRPLPIPHVPRHERLLVRRSRHMRSFYHVVARHGYMQQVRVDDAFVGHIVTTIATHVNMPSSSQRYVTTLIRPDGVVDPAPSLHSPLSPSTDSSPALSRVAPAPPPAYDKAKSDTPSAAATNAPPASGVGAAVGRPQPSPFGTALPATFDPEQGGASGSSSAAQLVSWSSIDVSDEACEELMTATSVDKMLHASRKALLSSKSLPIKAGAPTKAAQLPTSRLLDAPLGTISEGGGPRCAPSSSAAPRPAGALPGGPPGADRPPAQPHGLGLEEVLLLLDAKRRGVTHIVGRTHLHAAPGSHLGKVLLLDAYRALADNTASAASSWQLPDERLLELSLVMRS